MIEQLQTGMSPSLLELTEGLIQHHPDTKEYIVRRQLLIMLASCTGAQVQNAPVPMATALAGYPQCQMLSRSP